MPEVNQEEIAKVIKEASNIKLFFKYCIGGGMAFVVNFFLLFILTEYVGLYYLMSEAIAFVCAGAVNYSYNRIFTFQNGYKKIGRQFLLFLVIGAGGLMLDLYIMGFLVEKFGIWYMFAKLLSAFVVLFYNFTGNRLITFKVLQ